MNRFIERNPFWALLILIAIAFALWLIFATWPPGLEQAIGRKKVFLNAVFNGDHARRPIFPRRQRLHADLRPDAQRQSRAWLALSVRRLSRLYGVDRDRLAGCWPSSSRSSSSPRSAC